MPDVRLALDALATIHRIQASWGDGIGTSVIHVCASGRVGIADLVGADGDGCEDSSVLGGW